MNDELGENAVGVLTDVGYEPTGSVDDELVELIGIVEAPLQWVAEELKGIF